jgi:hypothetical protein
VEVVAVALGLSKVVPVSWLPPQQPHGQDVHSMGVGNVTLLLNNLLLSFHVCFSRFIV